MPASDLPQPAADHVQTGKGSADSFSMTNFASDVWQKGVINAIEEHPREAAITVIAAAAAIYVTRGKTLADGLESAASSETAPGAVSAADKLLATDKQLENELPISWGRAKDPLGINSIARTSADDAPASAGIKRPEPIILSASPDTGVAQDNLPYMTPNRGAKAAADEKYLAWVHDPNVPHPGPLNSYADNELARRGMTMPSHLPPHLSGPEAQEALERMLQRYFKGDIDFAIGPPTSHANIFGIGENSVGPYTTSTPEIGRLGMTGKTDIFAWIKNLKAAGGK
jgi:hypothetical protein